jgi:DegV family protein with EDD domain
MAFCDTTRLKILELLRSGEKSASMLLENVDTVQSTLSHHMKILVESRIVTARRSGKWTYYSISENGGRYAERLLKLLISKDQPAEAAILHSAGKEKRRSKNVKPFTIVIDTSCDLSPEFIAEHGIESMPITFMLDDVEHSMGYWQEISDKDFYNALRNGGVAKTSQVNPDAFVEVYKKYAQRDEEVLFIILSSPLSATYQSSIIALDEIRETYPDCKIYPVDSLGATGLNSILTMHAVKKRAEGCSAEETAAWLDEVKHYLYGVFTVDDLMYLHRGGRLSKLSAVGGSLLGIKPILGIRPDGSLALKQKVRGKEAAHRALITYLTNSTNADTVLDTVFITHGDNEEDANKLAEMVRAAANVKNIEIIMMCPVIGTHIGPGAVTLLFQGDITRQEYENTYNSD